jgi:hypothetical protein
MVRAARAYRTVVAGVAETEEKANRLVEREAALRKDLEQPQYVDLFRQTQFVNSLIEKKQLSLTDLVTKVTKMMPGQVRLNALVLAHQGNDLAVRFAITGRSEEGVETFLSNLEDSPDFKDVAIVNQGFQEEGASAGQVNIACTAHYLLESH